MAEGQGWLHRVTRQHLRHILCQDHSPDIMRRLNHKQIFLDTLRLYFAPLIGAVRGACREVTVVRRSIERRRRLENGVGDEPNR